MAVPSFSLCRPSPQVCGCGSILSLQGGISAPHPTDALHVRSAPAAVAPWSVLSRHRGLHPLSAAPLWFAHPVRCCRRHRPLARHTAASCASLRFTGARWAGSQNSARNGRAHDLVHAWSTRTDQRRGRAGSR
jgi:hypothetical protein